MANLVELNNDWTMLAFTDGLVEARVGQDGARLDTVGLLELYAGGIRDRQQPRFSGRCPDRRRRGVQRCPSRR